MKNMHTDVRMLRINQIHICMHSAAMMVKSRHILHTILKGAGSISLQNFFTQLKGIWKAFDKEMKNAMPLLQGFCMLFN